jgi:hypothetical protein
VQQDQLEAAVNCVGDSQLGKKSGLARLLDNAAVGKLGGIAQTIAAKQNCHLQQGRRAGR